MAEDFPGSARHASGHAGSDAVQEFLRTVALVARSIDPMLAAILGSGLEPVPDHLRWNRGRRNGLEFCLVMLGHARREAAPEADARRIDRAMSYIVLEFARLHHGQAVVPTA